LSKKTPTIIENGTTPCEPVARHTALDMGFSTFNPLQSRFVLEGLHRKDINILSAWPTSAGKTVVAELVTEDSISKGKKAIYACPLKSLAEEKVRRFRKLFPERKLEIFTGDYRGIENRAEKAASAEIAVVTTELLDSASRRAGLSQALIASAGAVIVDEAHIIATDRGPAVESALVKVTETNRDMRLVLLSATVGNPENVAQWLSGLNGKTTVVLKSSWRPVAAEWHVIDISDNSDTYFNRGKDVVRSAAWKIAELVSEDPEAQVLAFVWTKSQGIVLGRELQQMGVSSLFHNASLELGERLDFEEKFDKKGVRVLISTTTLAWGKNTCARHVVILGDKRGPERVAPWDVLQAGGRAGRTGLAPKGDVWWFTFEPGYASSVMKRPPKLESLLKNPRNLAFALVGEFPYRGSASLQKLRAWFTRTFAGKICRRETAESILVEALKILRNTAGAITDNLCLTRVGRAAKLFYLDPCEAKALEIAIAGSARHIPDLVQKIRSDHAPALVILMARVAGMRNIYVPKKEIESIDRECPTLKRKILPYVGLGLVRDYAHYAVVIFSLKWLEDMRNYLYTKAGKRPYPHYRARDFVWDIDRIGSAAEFLAKEMGLKELGETLSDASITIKYGAPPEASDLLKIKGIGAVRAVELLNAGIRTRAELERAIGSSDLQPIPGATSSILSGLCSSS